MFTFSVQNQCGAIRQLHHGNKRKCNSVFEAILLLFFVCVCVVSMFHNLSADIKILLSEDLSSL